MVALKSYAPSPGVIAFVDDLKAALGRHTDLSPVEMLAGAAQLVGTLIAMQDQRTMDAATAMEIVDANIASGNRAAVASLMQHPAGSA